VRARRFPFAADITHRRLASPPWLRTTSRCTRGYFSPPLSCKCDA